MTLPVKSVEVGGKYNTNSSGMLEVLNIINSKEVEVKFLDTGNIRVAQAGSIKKGEVKDLIYGVGYCNRSRGTRNPDGSIKKSYDAWRRLLYRCTPAWWGLHPTYKGVSVCDEWACYEVFAEWFESRNTSDDLEVEKDLLILGNKQYSPTTCCLLPNYINKAIVIQREHQGYCERNGKFEVNFMGGYRGTYEDTKAAQEAYIKLKVDHVRSLSNTNFIEDRAKEALLSFNLSVNASGFIERAS